MHRQGKRTEAPQYYRVEKLTDAVLKVTVEDAREQIEKYVQDKKIIAKYKNCKIKNLILVYNGWEMVFIEELTDNSGK